jgi:hypothetical protein
MKAIIRCGFVFSGILAAITLATHSFLPVWIHLFASFVTSMRRPAMSRAKAVDRHSVFLISRDDRIAAAREATPIPPGFHSHS